MEKYIENEENSHKDLRVIFLNTSTKTVKMLFASITSKYPLKNIKLCKNIK